MGCDNYIHLIMDGKINSERAEELMKDPKKGLFKLALPMIAAMLIHTLFNVVDTFFIGRIGPEAIAALTLSFPIVFLMIAFAGGIATGVTSLVSRYIGAKNKKGADNAAEHGIILSLIIAAIFTSIGLLFNKQIFSFFGLTGLTYEYSIAYMNIIFAGSVFLFFTFFAGAILRGEGDAKTPTKIISASLILNMILDPIFIYTLGLGVSGAAIATVLSRAVASALLVYFLFIKKASFVKFNLKDFKYSPGILKKIMTVGIPSSFTQMSSAIGIIATNAILATFGVTVIAGFGLFLRVESLIIMPIIGISTALITMIGMYTGSKQYDKLKQIFSYTTRLNCLLMSISAVVFFFSAEILIGIFTDSPEVIAVGTQAIRYMVIYFPFAAMGITASSAFQGMGRGMPALLLSLLRIVIIAIPLAYLFALVLGMGTLGVWLAFIISNTTTGILGYSWFRFQRFREASQQLK